MGLQTKIEIFPIAKTQVNRDVVRQWLAHLGVESDVVGAADEQAVTDPALLVALAGKTCYNSWEVSDALNPNVTRVRKDWAAYLDNILKSGHGSTLEHSVYSFALEGVTRVLTAELNRHRAGWAISERSLRYVRFGEVGVKYWEPLFLSSAETTELATYKRTLLANDAFSSLKKDLASGFLPLESTEEKLAASRILLERQFDDQSEWYALMTKIWEKELAPDSTFHLKKQLTSMFRRGVGMGCSTGGVWTGNMRALRHVIALRATPEAEEEICHVFSRIGKLMVESEPALFGDFEETNNFWTPKYPKV